MKNFLQVNQLFGTVGSLNQTDETLTRENRVGLMSYLRRTLTLLFAVLVMSIANIGMAWGAVYKTYALSDLTYTSATLTYEVTGISDNDQKLNKGERKVEVPCASASGTLYLSGTGANSDRYASIWGSNGTAVDESRKIDMTSGYNATGIAFTSADILTDGGKYYIVFSNVSGADYKINAFKYVLSSACGGGSSPSTSADTPGASGTVTFTSWTSLSTGTCYWKDGIKCFQYSSGGLNADAPNFTSKVDFGYMSPTAGSGWGSYNMSGLVTYAHFALGVSITTPSVVEVVVDNNQSNDLTLAKLFIKKDDVSYGTGYGSGNYTSGTDIKSRATITRVTDNTGRYKISIPVSASDLATTSPYIIKFYSNSWTNPIGFVFESVTVKPVYTVTYNANGKDGGGAAPTDGSSPYVSGSNVTVLGNTNSMTKTDCVFNGWNTRSDGTGTHYDVGAVISSISENITLYAEWVGYATSWEWWKSGQSNDGTTFTYITSKNYICSFASSASTAVASWDMSGGVYYRGIKIKTKDHYMYFWVQTGKRVSITFGTRPTKPTFTVGGVDKSSDVGASENADSITVTYTTTGDTKFYIENETATKTAFTIKSVHIENSCTAPSSPSISGTTTYTAGETISLIASASGTDASTTYQWYKGDPDNGGVSQGDASTSGATFSKASCVVADGATYYCVISNGEGCTVTTSQAVTVKPSVTVGPTVEDGNYGYRYTTGETIKLTATAGGASSYTYKWQKYVNSAWSDLANGLDATDGGTFSGVTTANLQISGCTTANVGSYRCVVTGGGQTNESTGYRVRVYTLHGYYFGDSEHAVDYPIVWTSETSGVATVSLNESSTYTFKITDNDGKWYGSGAGNYIIQPVSMNCGTSNTNVELRLLTGPAGSYTFTVDITNAQLGNGSDYVSVTTAYPSVTHPADGYIYLKKDWDHCYLYAWYDGSNKLTAWGDAEPEVTTYTSICDYNYFYMPALSYYTNFILHDKRGDGASNSTGNQSFTSNTGKLITHNGVSWVWQNIKKTISFNANGGTGTTASVKVCPGADVAAPANGFTRTGWEFDGWCSNKYGKGKKIYKPEDEISDVAADSTFYAMWKKTVYFKVGAGWDGSSAWYAIYCFDSENDNDPYRDWVRMNTAASSCETDVFKGDLPGNGYDKLIVCRMDGSKDALAWDSRWNQTGNISYDELDDNDQFTPTSLSGNECTGSWGTYSAPTYTISFAANGSDGGTDMTDVEDIECEGEVTLGPNTWTKTGYSFAGWKTNVAITANSSSVAANGIVTDEATISDITSDITLTAQWSQIMVTGITLDPTSKTLDVGNTQTITATVSPSTALDKSVTWSSSNRDVATVSSSGIVTAVAPGSATITATAHDGSGITQTCSITVNKLQPTKFDFSVDKTVLCDEETATLTLEDSEVGVTYELRSDATHSIDDTETDGTGEEIEWTGLGTGSYVVYAIENSTYNARQMNSSKITVSAGTTTSITTQPTDVTDATAGEETSLTVEAAGTSLTYQWKESSSQDGTYSNVASGGTSATYDVTPAAAGTTWYKCVVTGTCGTETTDAVKIVAAAAADPIITYTMNITSGADWGTSSTSTTDGTNISSLSANNTHASQLNDKTAKNSMTAGCTTAKSGTSRDEDIYVEFCFTVASGKTLIPSKVFLEVSNIGGSSDGKMTYDAILSDGTRSVSGSVTPASDGTLTELQFTNADDSKCMIGNVTLRVYPYNNDEGTTGSGFRMGQYVKIWGEIEDIPEYALTWDFNGGGCTETAGDDYTASGSVNYGTDITFPSDLSMSKPGYKFTGWSDGTSTYNEGDDYMMPNEDVEFTAQWESFTMPNVSGLDVDAGATLSSIPLSWSIPGICDLSKVMEPFTPNGGDGVGSKDSYTYNYNAGEDYDDVYAVGDAPKWGQYGIGFPLPSPTSGFEWLSYEYKGKRADMSFWLGIYNKDNTGEVYNDHDNNQALDDDENWQESGKLYPDKYYWGKTISGSLTDKSITHIAIYVNSGDNGANNDVPVSVRNIRYHLSGQNDIDHVVLMRKEGSAATGPADASATKLYEGTKSHYTDASDVTGKNYYYTVFAVHSNGAVSTGVSTSLTLYTITYNAGAYGTGTVAAGKKTHGINFTLSSSTFTRDGFTQDGWSTSDGEAKVYELGGTYSADEAIILYPHWVAVSGPVITNGNPANGSIAVTSDGSTPILSAVTGSTVYIAATPSTGYNFTSWDVYKTDDASTKVSTAAATASTTFEMPAYAVTVNASFSAKTYTVTLNGNGGSGNTANVTATYGSSSFSSSITNPTLLGYVFNGWYSGEGGTGTLIINSSGVLQSSTTYSDGSGNWTNDGAVTLYAKWTRDVKTAGWGAPWGGTAIPDATTSTVNSVTLNACNSTKGTLWSQESYKMGNGDSVTINLASGYYISAVSTAALFDEYGGNTNKLYIQFNSQSTYTNSKYDLDDPITLGDDCYKAFGDISTAPLASVSPISAGAQSAKIYCKGNSDGGNYLYRIVVEIKAWDCTPSSTITFAAGAGTGTAPQARKYCGTLTLPDEGGLSKEGYNFAGWNDGVATYFTGETYEVTEDVTFTAQWRDMETPLIIPTVTQLNATNYHYAPAFTKYDVDGSGAVKCINIEGQDSVDWKFKITPGYYSISIAYGAPSGLSTDVTAKIYEVGDVSDKFDRLVMSESFTTGSSDARTRLCSKIFKLNLDEDKTYRIVVKDTYSDASSHPCVGYINFTPLSSPMTIADDESLTYSNVVASPGTVVFDVKDDGNDVTCLNLEDQNMAEWFAYITPNTYTIKMLYGTAAWSTNLTFSIIDPTDGTSVYAPSAVTNSNGETHWNDEYTWSDVDLTGVSDSKPYIIRVKDTYGSKGSRPKIAHIDFIPTKYELAWSSNGGNALTGDYTSGDVAAGVAITAPDDPTRTGYDFVKWNSADDGSGNDFNTKMPLGNVTYYAQWEIIDYTIAHSDATNGSYTIKVGDASAVSTNTTGNYNQTVTLVATPSSGYVIDGWNVSGATVGNNNIASTTFTMPAGNVTVAPTFKLMPNVYYYQDGTRYASSTYKTPDGSTATSKDNQPINSGDEWTVSNSISGLTVSAKGCTYDGKTGDIIYMTSYLKVPKDGNASNQYVKFVVAAGYKVTSLKMKIGGYSSNPAVTLKPYTTELGDAISYTGTISGVATKENNFNEISWSNLAAGTYYLNVGTNNAYISEITAQTEQVGYTVSFAVDGGSTGYGTVSPSSITEVTHGSTVSISENVLTLKETAVTATATDASDEYTYAFDSWSVSDGASITSAQTITASFTRTAKEYTLTWDLNGGKVSTAGTAAAVDETEPSGSVAYNTALTAPVVTKSGYDFAGWTPSVADNMPAANTTYTAQWAERFTVTYNAMTGSVDPTSATGSTANKVSLPEPTKDGYDFDGWYNTAGEKIGDAGDKYGPTAAITLYAKWKGDCDAGSTTLFSASHTSSSTMSASTGTVSVSSGSSESANNGIKFSGDGGYILATGTSDFAAGDVIIVRVYNAGSSAKTIGFKLKSTNHNTSSNVSAGSTGDIEYTLVAGDIENDGTLKVYRSSSNSGDVRIQSVVVTRANACYTVTYHGNNATSGYVNDPEQYAEDATVYVSSSTGSYTRDGGYEFNGWNTKADGSGDKIAYFTITKDTTLYAQWRIVVNSNTTNLTAYDDPKHKDVRVTNGATLTLTQDTTVRNITVETGSTLNISKNGDDGIKFTVKSLSMKGGWGTVGGDTKYDMPRVFINEESSLVKTGSNIVNFDIAVDERNYYPIALPFDVALNDVNYVNSTLSSYVSSHRADCYGTYFAIKEYDGAKRAERGGNSENWKLVEEGILTPGKGYILSAVTVPGLLDADPYAVIRFPMSFTNAWTTEGEQGTVSEVTKNVIEVTAYEKAEGETAKTNKGWNLLGIPYMSCYQTGADMYTGDGAAAIMQGKFDFKTNKFDDEDEIRYVSVPTHDFSEYLQYNIVDEATKLLPGWCFFVQVEKTGNLTYAVTNQKASSDLPIYAPQREQEHKPTVKTGIILSGADASDKTTILVSDKYDGTEYEINADLEKMFGNAYTLATYSLMGETRLAYNAMTQIEAAGVIPIGYRAPADGEYTFAINPRYTENFEHVNLIDYETGFVTDLLQSTYTFATERTQNDERFALNVVTRQDAATDIENGANGGNGANGVRKLIINDKLYIIVDGKMYSAEGALVK